MHRTGIAFMAAMLVAVTAVASVAAPVATNIPVVQGWNLIGCPTVPLDPAPGSVFAGYTDLILRWDPLKAGGAGYVSYDEFSPEDFGNVLLGDGYWVFKSSAGSGNVSYSGADVSGDHWISLPKAGWTLIGYPNLTPTSVRYDALLVTNGIETKSMADAYAAGWISDSGLIWVGGGYASVGLPDAFPSYEEISGGQGCWLFTNVDNLALIVPGA